jgi:hypothetical protein
VRRLRINRKQNHTHLSKLSSSMSAHTSSGSVPSRALWARSTLPSNVGSCFPIRRSCTGHKKKLQVQELQHKTDEKTQNRWEKRDAQRAIWSIAKCILNVQRSFRTSSGSGYIWPTLRIPWSPRVPCPSSSTTHTTVSAACLAKGAMDCKHDIKTHNRQTQNLD